MKAPPCSLIVAVGLAAGLGGCREHPPESPAFPWIKYQAEEAQTTGVVHGPSRQYLTPEAEASGRSFVRLENPGEHLEFAAGGPANALVVRYCLPDSATGGGKDAALDLFVNGTLRQSIPLTSRRSWIYGPFPWSNDPSLGEAHQFFDEAQALIGDIRPGDVVRLQMNETASAPYCLVDFVDMEQAPPPLKQPEGSLALTDFGAVDGDGKDDSAALLSCLAAARQTGQPVWIPPGRFALNGPRIKLGGVKISGAGMWHSRLTGPGTMFEGIGEPVAVSDLAIFGDVDRRVDDVPENAFHGNFGDGSTFERLWIEHLKCGFWTTHGTSHLALRDSRLRNLMADGVNLCDGTTDSVVERCHLRNTGDDALATWSPTSPDAGGHASARNAFLHNLIELPWLANGIAIYGGADHIVRGNEIRETVFSGSGILISSGFGAMPLSGTIVVEDNVIIGTGGDSHIGEKVGGLCFQGRDSDMVASIVVRNLRIEASKDSAVTFHGPKAIRNVQVDALLIEGAGEAGIKVMPKARGSARIGQMQVHGAPGGELQNEAGEKFVVTRGAAGTEKQ